MKPSSQCKTPVVDIGTKQTLMMLTPTISTTNQDSMNVADRGSLNKKTEYSYTKKKLDYSTQPQTASYIIANGNIILQENSTAFGIGTPRSLLTSSGIKSESKSPQKLIPEMEMPESPMKVVRVGKGQVPNILKIGAIKQEQPSPKKIIRLFNPANGNKEFVITTPAETKKSTFTQANTKQKARILSHSHRSVPCGRPQTKVRLFHTNGRPFSESANPDGATIDSAIQNQPLSLPGARSDGNNQTRVISNQLSKSSQCIPLSSPLCIKTEVPAIGASTESSTPSSSSQTTNQPSVAHSENHVKLTSLKPSAEKMPLLKPISEGFDPGPTDDSLTNIQWLGSMSGQNLSVKEKDKPVSKRSSPATVLPTFHIVTEQHLDKSTKESTNKRPPYSYMHLIQMAINSKINRRMTLREIYKWIEEKFPYYRSSAKQGWKNSIRHNLSLYKIFVREKPQNPGKSGTSYWTLQDELVNKLAKHTRHPSLSTHARNDKGSEILPIANNQDGFSSSQSTPEVPIVIKPKKGPTPLLPKPPALPGGSLATFAIIPIPAGVSVMPPSPVVVSPWPVNNPGSQSMPTDPTYSSNVSSWKSSVLNASIKRVHSKDAEHEPARKHVRIAPKASILDKSSSRRIRTLSGTYSSSLDTDKLQTELSQIHMDSGIASDLSTCDSSSITETPSQPSQGLPKPVLSRHKRSRKDKVVVRRDCDEQLTLQCVDDKESAKENQPKEERRRPTNGVELKSSPLNGHHLHWSLGESAFSESFTELISSIEKDFTSPMKGLLTTPTKTDVKVDLPYTPISAALLSPSWISPIRNATSNTIEGRSLDSSLFTPEGKFTSTPNGGLCKTRGRTSNRIAGIKSPKLGSLRDLGLPGLTPLKLSSKAVENSAVGEQRDDSSPNTSLSNQSFQRLLGDLNLDSMMEDGVDLGNLSFLQC